MRHAPLYGHNSGIVDGDDAWSSAQLPRHGFGITLNISWDNARIFPDSIAVVESDSGGLKATYVNVAQLWYGNAWNDLLVDELLSMNNLQNPQVYDVVL